MDLTLGLSKPVPAVGGGDVGTLTFREMTGGDLIACGNPVGMRTSDIKGKAGFGTTDAEAVGKLIAKLTGLPPSSVALMTARDFNRAQGIVMGFLRDDEEDTTPATS